MVAAAQVVTFPFGSTAVTLDVHGSIQLPATPAQAALGSAGSVVLLTQAGQLLLTGSLVSPLGALPAFISQVWYRPKPRCIAPAAPLHSR